MQQFEGRTGVDHSVVALVAARTDESPIGEHRAQSFAATHDHPFEFAERNR